MFKGYEILKNLFVQEIRNKAVDRLIKITSFIAFVFETESHVVQAGLEL